jgi:hypothetical protein
MGTDRRVYADPSKIKKFIRKGKSFFILFLYDLQTNEHGFLREQRGWLGNNTHQWGAACLLASSSYFEVLMGSK